jgi:hypothetical protein
LFGLSSLFAYMFDFSERELVNYLITQ